MNIQVFFHNIHHSLTSHIDNAILEADRIFTNGLPAFPGSPNPVTLMIIDAHAHIYDILSGYGAKGEFRPLGQGKGIWSTGEVNEFFPPQYGDKGFLAETLLQLMDDGGIDHAVLLQGSNYGFHNHYAAETAKKYPTRFTASITVDPYAVYAKEILRNFAENWGVHILKFEMSKAWGLRGYHPELTPDSTRMHPLLSIAEEEDMTVVIDPGPVEDIAGEANSFLRLKDRFPQLNLVLAHCFFPRGDGKILCAYSFWKHLPMQVCILTFPIICVCGIWIR